MSDIQVLNYRVPLVIGAIIAAAAIYVTFTSFIELSAFGMMLGKMVVMLAAASIVDNVVFKSINTVDEIKKGNIAFAVVYAGLMLIIAAAGASV